MSRPMGSAGSFPVKNSQSTARLSANSAAEPAKTSNTMSPSPQIRRTIDPGSTNSATGLHWRALPPRTAARYTQLMSRGMLHLIVGLPGAGKTTLARQLERELPALRLTPDDWIGTLYGEPLAPGQLDAVRDPVEHVQWAVAERALA